MSSSPLVLPVLALEKIVEASDVRERYALSQTCQVLQTIAQSSKFAFSTITKAHLELPFGYLKPLLKDCDDSSLLLKGCGQETLIKTHHVKEIGHCWPVLRELTLQDISISLPNPNGTSTNILRFLPDTVEFIRLVRVQFLQEGVDTPENVPQSEIALFMFQLFGCHEGRTIFDSVTVGELPALEKLEVETARPIPVVDLTSDLVNSFEHLVWLNVFGPCTHKYVDADGQSLHEMLFFADPNSHPLTCFKEHLAQVKEAQSERLLHGKTRKMEVTRPGHGQLGTIVAHFLYT